MALIEVRIRGQKQVIKKFADITINVRSEKLGADAIDKGYRFAQKIAPHYTGATKRALKRIRSPKGGTSRLRLYQPLQNRSDPRPYHLWMHGLRRDNAIPAGHITSGDPYFMYTTHEYMKEYALKKISKEIKK